MTIQSLVNQALNTATIAAGLYAHSPKAQQGQKLNALSAEAQGHLEKLHTEQEALRVKGQTAKAKMFASRLQQLAEVYKERFEITGDPQDLERYLETDEERLKNVEIYRERERNAANARARETHRRNTRARAVQEGQERLEENTNTQAQQRQTRNAINEMANQNENEQGGV